MEFSILYTTLIWQQATSIPNLSKRSTSKWYLKKHYYHLAFPLNNIIITTNARFIKKRPLLPFGYYYQLLLPATAIFAKHNCTLVCVRAIQKVTNILSIERKWIFFIFILLERQFKYLISISNIYVINVSHMH